MPEFTVIETQEQFDAAIKDRLERERNTVRKEFADYDSLKRSLEAKTKSETELTGKISEYEKRISELTGKLSKSESDSAKTRIAYELGLPFEMSSRLVGTTEEEIRKDAEALSKFVKSPKSAPLFNPEAGSHKGGNQEDQAYRTMLNGLKI